MLFIVAIFCCCLLLSFLVVVLLMCCVYCCILVLLYLILVVFLYFQLRTYSSVYHNAYKLYKAIIRCKDLFHNYFYPS